MIHPHPSFLSHRHKINENPLTSNETNVAPISLPLHTRFPYLPSLHLFIPLFSFQSSELTESSVPTLQPRRHPV